mmetsp:Transcript_22870/g.26895  ORF Transcript_22870/g.26895 Transcript_22870/m.26895 type:complete len:104 (+) Transcript_22870:106-417(+)
MKHTKFTIYTDIGTSFGFLTGWSSSVGRCATQKFDEPRALFPHPGAMHLFPPPWATQNFVDPLALLEQPGISQRFPPPCPTQNFVEPLTLFKQPGISHRLPPP